jgi:spore germination protein
MTDFCDIFLLQNTPHYILMSLLLLPMILIVRAGTETLVRMTEILVPVSLVVLLAIPVLGIHSVDLNHLKPLFDFHWDRIGFGSWYLLGYIGDLFLLPFLWGGSTMRIRAAAAACGLCGISLFMVFFFQITIVGIAPSSRLTFATYELVRQLEITDFLDRFELIIVVFYFPVTLLKITYSLSLLCRGVAHIFPKLSAQALASPIGLASMVSSFLLYDDLIQLYHLNTLWPYLTLFYGFALPLLVLLIWRKPKPFLR